MVNCCLLFCVSKARRVKYSGEHVDGVFPGYADSGLSESTKAGHKGRGWQGTWRTKHGFLLYRGVRRVQEVCTGGAKKKVLD